MSATIVRSPFAQAAGELGALGFNVLPILPPDHPSDGRGKAPGAYLRGRWTYANDWQRFGARSPTDFELRMWRDSWPNANIGLVLGSPAGAALAHFLVAVDIDT